jgi:hypothetical protein
LRHDLLKKMGNDASFAHKSLESTRQRHFSPTHWHY